MSGGISAIKGFDYQATVILDRLFNHFDNHGPSAQVRPEGIDDLDLSWIEKGTEHRQFVQIKKPTENNNGMLNPTPWTLPDTVRELLPSTIAHLSGNGHKQLWIVGDKFDEKVSSLICAGVKAPIDYPLNYWGVVHGLIRNEILVAFKIEASVRQKLIRWKIPSTLSTDPTKAELKLVTEFNRFVSALNASEDISPLYAARVKELHDCLPGVLARIDIFATYGSEQEVIQRVHNELMQRYSFSSTLIEHTLFRNLRGFINDIAKQAGRSFNQEELEIELRCVWPHMIPVKDLPLLESDHVTRRDLVEQFTTSWTGKAIEAIGISGSGKTTLATEIAERSLITSPNRLVYYVEVRPNISLRDVLAGVAFHLRRLDIHEPFSIAIRSGAADEDILVELARSFSAMARDTFLLIDLVEGTCGTAFSRDLATFIRALSSSCQIVVFGQESAMRELNSLERDEHGVSRVDIRGFDFEEFAKLVSHYHSNAYRAVLWDVYHRVTAGRASGLFAKLAQALAKSASLKDMLDIAAKPAEDILAHAEQKRFTHVSEGARNAAEKLVCFALPFQRKVAEEIFPEENVGVAIRELLTQGLLRYHDKDSFEMHETVRAGLESMLAKQTCSSAHQKLAAWYGKQGQVTAEIFHLEKASKLAEAKVRARELFMRGEQWSAISAYITRHNLVSTKDVIDVISRSEDVRDNFLLSSILSKLGTSTAVSELTQLISEQRQRYFNDYRWSKVIVETILEFDPQQLHSLITFSIDNAANKDQMVSALRWLEVAAMRKGCVVASHTIAFFNTQQPHIKRQLIGVFLGTRHRAALQVAFQFITSDQQIDSERRNQRARDYTLHIDSLDYAVEVLAAIPKVELSAMLISKSAQLGELANLVWTNRRQLRTYCIEVLNGAFDDEAVTENAIRVLIFLAEPSLFRLCEPLLIRQGNSQAIVALLPVFQPTFFDYCRHESQILDGNLALTDRFAALSIFALTGADLSGIYQQLKVLETAPERQQIWEFMFLLMSGKNPFPEAITLLQKHLGDMDDNSLHTIIPALIKLGELAVPEAITLLTQAVMHSNAEVRKNAVLGLSKKRSRMALPALIKQYAMEDNEMLAVGLATAIVASGAKSVSVLQGRLVSPSIQLWQCILAMRARDIELADMLIRIAVDPLKDWQLRRAAIFAAGRLPYEVALDRIFPVIMNESSPLTIDQSDTLCYHSFITTFLSRCSGDLMYIFAKGREGFIDFFADIFEEAWGDAAGWFYDRLVVYGWPTERGAPNRILNELSIPLLQSGVLRSLRLCEREELIEQQLASAKHVWIAMKCLIERKRAGKIDTLLVERLRSLVEVSPCRGNTLLHRIIAEMDNSRTVVVESKSPDATPDKSTIPVTYITYDDAVDLLSGGASSSSESSSLMLEDISLEQCERLIRLADPVHDVRQGVETFIPMIGFTSNGHVVGRRQYTSKGSNNSLRGLIRPAIAAANRFGLLNPWIHSSVNGAISRDFVKRYLKCLAALNDSARFYEELSKYEDTLILSLCDLNQYEPVQKYIDARIIPTLMRYVSSGTDNLFEGLCRLTLQVTTPEVDSVLSSLLYRWSQRFDVTSIASQHDDNYPLWRGFKRLTEHPRFTKISGWMSLLEQVLLTPIAWFHAQDIVRVLEGDPRSYTLIESRLFKTENWEHCYVDEIDRLDDAAERLFLSVQED